jgi:hypothetical protein
MGTVPQRQRQYGIVTDVLHLTSLQTRIRLIHSAIMQAFRNLFKNDLVLVGTNLTVVAGFATYLGIASPSNSVSITKRVILCSNNCILQDLG